MLPFHGQHAFALRTVMANWGLHSENILGDQMFLTGQSAFARNYTTLRRRLSSITRAPCRKVMGVRGQRSQAAR